jgi:hypothetical protein
LHSETSLEINGEVLSEFLKSGKLAKTAYFTAFKIFSGKLMVSRLKFVDHLRRDMETIITYSNVKNEKIPGHYFNMMAMPRLSEILKKG